MSFVQGVIPARCSLVDPKVDISLRIVGTTIRNAKQNPPSNQRSCGT